MLQTSKVFPGQLPGHNCCCFAAPTGKASSHIWPLLSTGSSCAPQFSCPVLLCPSGQTALTCFEAVQSPEPPPSLQEHNLPLNYLEIKGQSKHHALPPSDNHPAPGLFSLEMSFSLSNRGCSEQNCHRKGDKERLAHYRELETAQQTKKPM